MKNPPSNTYKHPGVWGGLQNDVLSTDPDVALMPQCYRGALVHIGPNCPNLWMEFLYHMRWAVGTDDVLFTLRSINTVLIDM